MYYYWAYGLTICSEVEFPELYPISVNTKFDLEIKVGSALTHSQEALVDEKGGMYISSKEYKLIVSSVAIYWAENGNKIIIQPDSKAEMSTVRLFCLSNVFAAILNQRSIIPLHASAILIKNRLVMICGHSGAGKSTLLATLLSKGYTIFSDDVCVPVYGFNKVLFHSSYPVMKFWGETINRIPALGNPDVQLRPGINKFGFYFHNQFNQSPVEPHLVFFLGKSDQVRQVEISEVKGYGLFQCLESNAYRAEYLSAVELRKEHFDLFSKLANQVRGFEIKRPVDFDSIDEVTDLLVSIIEKELPNE